MATLFSLLLLLLSFIASVMHSYFPVSNIYKIVLLNIIFISHSLTNKTDRHDATEILLKVALNTLTLTLDTRKVYQYTELVCLW